MASWSCSCGKVKATIKNGEAIITGVEWWVKGTDKTHIVCGACKEQVRVGYTIVSEDHKTLSTYKSKL